MIKFAAPAGAQSSFEARLYHDILETKASIREADLELTAVSLHLIEQTRESCDASHSLENGIPLPSDVFKEEL